MNLNFDNDAPNINWDPTDLFADLIPYRYKNEMGYLFLDVPYQVLEKMVNEGIVDPTWNVLHGPTIAWFINFAKSYKYPTAFYGFQLTSTRHPRIVIWGMDITIPITIGDPEIYNIIWDLKSSDSFLSTARYTPPLEEDEHILEVHWA